jgi:Proliferating cell nuclear antigen, C-terminal domain
MLFRAKFQDGRILKMLSEVIQMNKKFTYFTINEKGIFMRVTDDDVNILFDLELHSDKFLVHEFNHSEPIHISLNLEHLVNMLDDMKKKDTIEFIMKDLKLENSCIRVIPRENSNMVNIELPSKLKYARHVNILSDDFQKMIKDFSHISNDIKIRATEHTVTFCCMIDKVSSKQITFGNDGNYTSKQIIFGNDIHDDPVIYEGEFDIVRILNIIKISRLDRRIQLFCTTGMPILIKSHVGNMGELRIYIKSNDMD